ncbi:MAG: diaminopimelate epimerase [Planctomycetes bacterium]|nr:diaminopimelate epimerase [Planctomycetota bacterium]
MTAMQDVRMHGASNRFLIHFGQGDVQQLLSRLGDADGLLLVEQDQEVDATMRIINADGSEAKQCGNGIRCVALHLLKSKLVDGNTVTIRTLAGVSKCEVSESSNEVAVTLCVPTKETVSFTSIPELTLVDMGNQNAVLWVEEDPLKVRETMGEQIATHKTFTDGMNVHIARRDGAQYATCASYERGVGNTHASGTGGAAVFVASGVQGPFYVSSVGGTLTFSYNEKGEVVMAGPACYE